MNPEADLTRTFIVRNAEDGTCLGYIKEQYDHKSFYAYLFGKRFLEHRTYITLERAKEAVFEIITNNL